MKDDSSDQRIEALRRRIEATPLDLALRFELGAALFHKGDARSAVPELQRARNDPNHRIAAMGLIIKALAALGNHLSDNETPDVGGPIR